MRLSKSERAHVREQVAHFASLISDAKIEKKSIARTFDSMLTYEAAQAIDAHHDKVLDDVSATAAQFDYTAASKKASLTYISGIYAMEYELSKRTWRDYLFHPFRSIGERLAFNRQKELVKDRYNLEEKQFKSMMDNLAEINGDPRRHGTPSDKELAAQEKASKKKIGAREQKAAEERHVEEVLKESEREANNLFPDDDAKEHGTEKKTTEFEKKINERFMNDNTKAWTLQEMEQAVGEQMKDFLGEGAPEEEKLDTEKLAADVSLEKKGTEKSKPVATAKQQPQAEMTAPAND